MDEIVNRLVEVLKDLSWQEAQKALDLASHQVKVRPPAVAEKEQSPAPRLKAKEPTFDDTI